MANALPFGEIKRIDPMIVQGRFLLSPHDNIYVIDTENRVGFCFEVFYM